MRRRKKRRSRRKGRKKRRRRRKRMMRRKSTIYDKTNNSINIWPEMELFKRQFDRHSTSI